MYAIVEDRGGQYKVRTGERVRVPRLAAEEGSEVLFERVLLVGKDDGEVLVGAPTVEGARVVGVNEGEIKSDKVISIHRIKTNSMAPRRGHRAKLNVVRIEKIEV